MIKIINTLFFILCLLFAITACDDKGGSNSPSKKLISNAVPGSLSAGPATAAYINELGILRAWGHNESYQLCDGTDNPSDVPVVIDPPVDANDPSDTLQWLKASVGGYHIIAIARNNQAEWSLWAWGNNGEGQLGLGNMLDLYVDQPAQVGKTQTGMDKGWKFISAGKSHNAAIKTDGKLYTWGYNDYCQLGYSTIPYYNPTLQQVGTESGWTDVSAGWKHTLAIKNTVLYAWGRNLEGQCGNGNDDGADVCTPEYISSGWEQVSAGFLKSAGVKTNGTLWVWGGTYGLAPVQVGTDDDWDMVAVGSDNGEHFLAIKTDGSLWAWGYGGNGELGTGVPPSINYKEDSPVEVEPGTVWQYVSAGDYYSLGLRGAPPSYGVLYSWGDGSTTGIAGNDDIYVPTEVDFD